MPNLALDQFIDISPVLTAGVYALAKDGVIVYVGKASKATLARISAHRANWGRKAYKPDLPRGILFDQVFIRPCHPDRLDALEREMINLYKPRLNIKLKTAEKIGTEFHITIGDLPIIINRPKPPFERRI